MNILELHHSTAHDWEGVANARSPISFHGARNQVLGACGKHGTTGAMGPCPIVGDKIDEDAWPVGADEPDFYVIEDLWHLHQSYVVVLCEIGLISEDLLHDLWTLDCVQADWIIRIQCTHQEKPTQIEIVLMKNGFLSTGWALRRCNTLADVLAAGARYRESGAARLMHSVMTWLTGWHFGRDG